MANKIEDGEGMLCPSCELKMEPTVREYHYIECGLEDVFIPDCEVYVCKTDGIEVAMLPNARLLAREITKELLSLESPLRPDAVLFLRKALGMTAAQLAAEVGVHRGEISRWENGRSAISGLYDFKLRVLVIGNVLGHEDREAAMQQIPAVLRRYVEDATIQRPIKLDLSSIAAAPFQRRFRPLPKPRQAVKSAIPYPRQFIAPSLDTSQLNAEFGFPCLPELLGRFPNCRATAD